MMVTAPTSPMPRSVCSASTTGASDQLGRNSAIAASIRSSRSFAMPNGEQTSPAARADGRGARSAALVASAGMLAPQAFLPGNTRPWRSIMDEIACRLRRRSSTAASRARTRSRIASCASSGTHTAVSSPARSRRASCWRVAAVGLDPIARLARDQRRRDYCAAVAQLGQLPVQAIAGRAGLVAEVKPAPVPLLQLGGETAHALRRRRRPRRGSATSPRRPSSATATACRSLATSMPTKTSLCCSTARPPALRIGPPPRATLVEPAQCRASHPGPDGHAV